MDRAAHIATCFGAVGLVATRATASGWASQGGASNCAVSVEGEGIGLAAAGLGTPATLGWGSLAWAQAGDMNGLEPSAGRAGVIAGV